MGLWHTHRSPNPSQKTWPNNNQQKKKKKKKKRENWQNCRLCCSGWSQNKTERKVKWRISTGTLLGGWKKLWNMKVTIIPIVIGAFGTVTKGLLMDLEDLEVEGRVEHYWKRPEYWEESWRLEETCCLWNSSERPSAKTNMKNSSE